MIRDITIGQYYPADSILHRLDPRVKFVSTLVYIVSLFVFSSWLGYGVAALFLVAMIVLSKVPFGFMIKGLKPIMVLLLITMFFNLVFTPGEVLWSFWILKITKEGIRLAIKMGIRLVFLIIEAIRRKPIDREKEGMVHAAGMFLLLALMVFIMFNDVRKLL